MRYLFVLFLLFFLFVNGKAQELPSTETQYDSIYNFNIRLSKINGTYIPKDLSEAFVRLKELTPDESLEKFISQEELVVCKKLHFGIGRWMIFNWNFYQGSRFSHYLREKGLTHPDDMAQFVLRTFHRHLLSVDLNEEEIVDELTEARKKEVEYLRNN